MKSYRNMLAATLMTAGAVLTAAAGMSIASAADEAPAAQPPAPPPGPAPGPAGWNHHGPWHLLGRLGLSDAQKQQIKGILAAARPQMESLRAQIHANSAKLRQTQPSDPNYATITSQRSRTQGSLTAQMMAQRAAVRAQVFKVLTPEQQTQLAALEAQMPARTHGARGAPDSGPGEPVDE